MIDSRPIPFWIPGEMISDVIERIIDKVEARGDLAREYVRGRLEAGLYDELVEGGVREGEARDLAVCGASLITGRDSHEARSACFRAGRIAQMHTDARRGADD